MAVNTNTRREFQSRVENSYKYLVQPLRCEPAIWPGNGGLGPELGLGLALGRWLGIRRLGLGLRARVHFPSTHGCAL